MSGHGFNATLALFFPFISNRSSGLFYIKTNIKIARVADTLLESTVFKLAAKSTIDFFCFTFNKKVPLGKPTFFAYIYFSKMKQHYMFFPKKGRTLFNTPKQTYMSNLESPV